MGLTSFLLKIDGGEFAFKNSLDLLFPVDGYKRCKGNGFGKEGVCSRQLEHIYFSV